MNCKWRGTADHISFAVYIRQYETDEIVTEIHLEDFLTSREAAWNAKIAQPWHIQFSFSEQKIELEDHLSLILQYDHAVPYIFR